jgi:glucose 1-dehydrogenase/3-oxoacyl-[acyl-carrier protein] reductase
MGGRLDGRAALVTGARRGIGRGCALALVAEGASVALNDIEGTDQLAAVAAEVRELGGRAVCTLGDVTKRADVERMVGETVAAFGSIDILVNNAGVESIVPLLDLTEEEWERVTHTNLKGEWLCAQAAARRMIAQGAGGAIVNIGSVQAGMVMPGRTHYAPAKRAVEALTANLAVELAEHGIRVNCVHPGLIETDMTAWVMDDPTVLPTVLDRIALRRAGQPTEIGSVVAFLASDAASYVTGQSLYVDGGFRIL